MHADAASQPDDWDLFGGNHTPYGSGAQLQRLRDILHCKKPCRDRGCGTGHDASPGWSPFPARARLMISAAACRARTRTKATKAALAGASVAEAHCRQLVASGNANWGRLVRRPDDQLRSSHDGDSA